MGNSFTLLSATSPAKRVGPPLYSDRWSNAKCTRIAAMVSKGYSCTAIAAELNDGIRPNQIANMVVHWG